MMALRKPPAQFNYQARGQFSSRCPSTLGRVQKIVGGDIRTHLTPKCGVFCVNLNLRFYKESEFSDTPYNVKGQKNHVIQEYWICPSRSAPAKNVRRLFRLGRPFSRPVSLHFG